jgi:peptidoglycan/LPS O-acetylase OafA/YrhL
MPAWPIPMLPDGVHLGKIGMNSWPRERLQRTYLASQPRLDAGPRIPYFYSPIETPTPPATECRMPHVDGSTAPRRFAFIDALRGIAAVWVAGYHLYGGLSNQYARHTFPEPFHSLLRHGNCGVEIFFVISGFVIAYSIRNALITPGYYGNFVLRRCIRLDPPYWATIVLALAAGVVAGSLRSDRSLAFPSLGVLAAHLCYLQNLLGLGNVVEVFWTLCIEVQFYLTFLLLCGLAQVVTRKNPTAAFFIFGPLALWSFGIRAGVLTSPHPALMLKFWYLFQLGALAWWAIAGYVRSAWFLAYVLVLGAVETRAFTVESSVGLLTGLTVYLVARAGYLERLLDVEPVQFFGRISYSLYLVHPVVGVPFTYFFARRWAGSEPTTGAALGLFAVAFAVSTVTAYMMYRCVERPSVALSGRLKGGVSLAWLRGLLRTRGARLIPTGEPGAADRLPAARPRAHHPAVFIPCERTRE